MQVEESSHGISPRALEASIMAVEAVDRCVGQLISVIEKLEGIAIITADHGNVDEKSISPGCERQL